MIEAFGLLLPIFVVIAIGRAAVQLRLIDPAGVRGINEFTVRIAFPALLFASITNGAVPQVFGVAGVYLAGCLAVYGLALLLARVALGTSLAQGAAFALNATYGSAAYIALPVVSATFGAAGLSQIVPIIALHSGVLLPLAGFLIEIGSQGTNRAVLRHTAQSLIRNPIVMSLIIAFVWNAGGVPVPPPLRALLNLLGAAAPSLALFCVGASLPVIAGGYAKEAMLATTLKLGVLPITIGALSIFAGLSGLPLKVALVTAAMPTGANAFLVARRAAAFTETSAQIVVISLIVSLPILSGLLMELR